MPDYDPRLVDLYDLDNPDGPDHDFYRALAADLSAASILDLGCGTGMLTVSLAAPGRTVVGVDPSPSMLASARRRPGGDAVAWCLGDSRAIPPGPFDLAVMTGNVAQHIPEDDWARTLRDLHAALEGGGTLAFESRNPRVRAWEGWNSSGRTSRSTPHGTLIEWMDAEESAPGVVTLCSHNIFESSGETLTETLTLSFRERHAILEDLAVAGFDVEAVYGDWQRTPFSAEAPLMVFAARRR